MTVLFDKLFSKSLTGEITNQMNLAQGHSFNARSCGAYCALTVVITDLQ